MKFIYYTTIAFFLTSYGHLTSPLHVYNKLSQKIMVVAQEGTAFDSKERAAIYYVSPETLKHVYTEPNKEYFVSILNEAPHEAGLKPRFERLYAAVKKYEDNYLITIQPSVVFGSIEQKVSKCKIVAIKF